MLLCIHKSRFFVALEQQICCLALLFLERAWIILQTGCDLLC